MNGEAIDRLLEESLKCPRCGSRDFGTGQRGHFSQDIVNGDWRRAESSSDSETVEVQCHDCGMLIWTADQGWMDPDVAPGCV